LRESEGESFGRAHKVQPILPLFDASLGEDYIGNVAAFRHTLAPSARAERCANVGESIISAVAFYFSSSLESRFLACIQRILNREKTGY